MKKANSKKNGHKQRGEMILKYLRRINRDGDGEEKQVTAPEIAKATGDDSKLQCNTRSALSVLVKSGEARKVARGIYAIGDGSTEVDDVNSALERTNGLTSSMKKMGESLISNFRRAGRELTKITLTVAEGGKFIVHYEALEKGEVIL